MLFQNLTPSFIALVLGAILSGCVPNMGVENRPVDMKSCDLETYETLLWMPASVLDDQHLPKQTRIIHPGQAVTADYRTDRLNFKIGKLKRIEQVFCG
jgi:hypothetical protein